MVIGKTWIGKATRHAALALAIAPAFPAPAATEGLETASVVALHASRHPVRQAGIDDRINTLSQALNLDAAQQAGVKKLLEDQREQVMKVWSDAAVPAAFRISATQAISVRTSDQIRALLNEEQKSKYNQPRQPHAPTASSQRSVEAWMDTGKDNALESRQTQ